VSSSSFTFKKSERLKKRKYIEALFSTGKALSHFPLKCLFIIYEKDNTDELLQFGISVPKRKFKTAVERNLLKRRCREAWRLNKNELQTSLQQNNIKMHVFFIYQSHKALPYATFDNAMKKIIPQLITAINTPPLTHE